MPKSPELNLTPTEDEMIATYEREFTRSTAEQDAELARVTLENALYGEFGEVRDGARIIPADQ